MFGHTKLKKKYGGRKIFVPNVSPVEMKLAVVPPPSFVMAGAGRRKMKKGKGLGEAMFMLTGKLLKDGVKKAMDNPLAVANAVANNPLGQMLIQKAGDKILSGIMAGKGRRRGKKGRGLTKDEALNDAISIRRNQENMLENLAFAELDRYGRVKKYLESKKPSYAVQDALDRRYKEAVEFGKNRVDYINQV